MARAVAAGIPLQPVKLTIAGVARTPHIARMLIGGDHRVLLPFAAIVGALLLLTADVVGRLAFAPVIIPVGIVVAYLGVPIFLHLLLSRRQDLMA
jgi:iron complex transport system permease protein